MMAASKISTLLVLVVAVTGVSPRADARPRASQPESTDAGPRRVMLEVDARGMNDESAKYEGMAQHAIVKALTEHGFEVVEDNAEEIVGVVLSWENYEDSVFKTEWSVITKHEALRRMPSDLCSRCTDNEFVTKLKSELDVAVAILDEPGPETATPEDHSHNNPDAADPEDTGGSSREDDPRRLSSMAAVGIGVGVLGLAGVVVGAVLLPRSEQTEFGSDGGLSIDGKRFRSPGIWSLGGGGVALATGVALIIAGQVRQKKRRARASTSLRGIHELSWSPGMSGHAAGVRFSGRF